MTPRWKIRRELVDVWPTPVWVVRLDDKWMGHYTVWENALLHVSLNWPATV